MHFLIVDDDVAVVKLMTTYLEKKGSLCSSLTNSTEVIPWLERNPVDAIVLDIGMPGIDGLTLIPLIREKFADVPVIIFTGMGYDSEAMQKARKAGANGFVSKGLPPDEVFLALQRVMAARTPR